jgi:hypothetical protein
MEYTITVKLSSDNFETVVGLAHRIECMAVYVVENVSIHTKEEK